MPRYKIFLREKQLQQNGLNVVVSCTSAGIGSYIFGNVLNPNWIEFTEFSEIENGSLGLEWKENNTDYVNNNSNSITGSNYSKGVSNSVSFGGMAYNFIFNFLYTTPCQRANIIECRIFDVACQKYYRTFEIKADNIEYCPKEKICKLTVPLREADLAWHHVHKTMLEDNWQNWFNKDGTSAKNFRQVKYVIDKKEKMIIDYAMVLLVGALTGGTSNLFNGFDRWLNSSLGFNYFCPSPTIHEYIVNFCTKYGYTWNTIFQPGAGVHENDVMFYPVKDYYENHDGNNSPSMKFIYENRTAMTFAQFFNSCNPVYNARWTITPNNVFIFQPETWWEQQATEYDFSTNVPIELIDVCYRFDASKPPAYGRYEYSLDPQDTCTNDINDRYRDIVDFDGNVDNTVLEGQVDKTVFDFAATAFMGDAGIKNSWSKAITIATLAIIAAAAGLITYFTLSNGWNFGAIGATIAGIILQGIATTTTVAGQAIIDNALAMPVRCSQTTINKMRIININPQSNTDETYVNKNTPASINANTNSFYNPLALTIDNFIKDTDGNNVAPAFVPNFHMYFNSNFNDTLFNYYHYTDNPVLYPQLNQDILAKVAECCNIKNVLGFFENDYVKIGKRFIVENRTGRIIVGRLTEIKQEAAGFISLIFKITKNS